MTGRPFRGPEGGVGCTMQRIQGQSEGTLCALWAPLKTRTIQDPESPTACALPPAPPLFVCCYRKRRVSTNDEGLWNVRHVRGDGGTGEERDAWFVTSGVWLTCLPPCMLKLLLSITHLSDQRTHSLCCSMPPCPLWPHMKRASSRRVLKAGRCLWKAGYPRPGTPTLPTLWLSCQACWLLSCPLGLSSSWGRREEKCCRKCRVLQDASGVNVSSYLAVVTCGSGSGPLATLLSLHC